jgi:DNA-directed RNA polymerase specialized sigma24 family protein
MSEQQRAPILRHLYRHFPGAGCHELTDRQLLERFAHQQNETAFAALVHRHGPLVQGVCRRVLGRAEDAEDAFQATFMVLARKAALGWRESVGRWLYQAAYRVASEARTRRLAPNCSGRTGRSRTAPPWASEAPWRSPPRMPAPANRAE